MTMAMRFDVFACYALKHTELGDVQPHIAGDLRSKFPRGYLQ